MILRLLTLVGSFSDCKNNDCLYDNRVDIWTITSSFNISHSTFVVLSSGLVYYRTNLEYVFHYYIPVLCLKREVEITDNIHYDNSHKT